MKRYCKNCHRVTESITELNSCPQCGAPFDSIGEPDRELPESPSLPPVQPQAQKSEHAEPKYTPWEDRDKLGFIGSLFETWKESVFSPSSFYRKMPVKGGIGNPILYGLILGFIGLVFQMMYNQVFGQLFDPYQWQHYMGRDFDYDFYEFSRQIESISYLFLIFVTPFLLAAWFFIASGILHLILVIFGWNKEDFEATFRIVAYSEGTSFFEVIPLVGGLVSVIWGAVLMIIGVKEVHKLSIGQALLVVFLPLILCCACCCGGFSMIAGLVGIAD